MNYQQRQDSLIRAYQYKDDEDDDDEEEEQQEEDELNEEQEDDEEEEEQEEEEIDEEDEDDIEEYPNLAYQRSGDAINNYESLKNKFQQLEDHSLRLSQSESLRDTAMLNLLSKLSQQNSSMVLLQNSRSQESLFSNKPKNYSFLYESQHSREAPISRTTCSSFSNFHKQIRKKLESSDNQLQNNYGIDDDEIGEEEEEELNNHLQLLEQDEDEELQHDDEEEDHQILQTSKQTFPLKGQSLSKKKVRQRKDNHSFKVNMDENNNSNKINNNISKLESESALINAEKIQEFMKLDPIEKLVTFKKYKQTFQKQNTLSVRKFFCEILYDQIEEEKIIKIKYISPAIQYIFSCEEPLPNKYLAKLIEDKELRTKQVKEVFRAIFDEKQQYQQSIQHKQKQQNINNSQKNSHSYLQPYHSIYRIQKFQNYLQSLLNEKNKDAQSELENNILKDLHEHRQEIIYYEDNQSFKDLIQQIIIQKTKSIYNFQKFAELIASFLLNSDLSIQFIIKGLLDYDRLEKMCNSAIDIIRVLSKRDQKYEDTVIHNKNNNHLNGNSITSSK